VPWLPRCLQAFETALKALGMTAEQLLGNKELLDAILSFHVVPAVVTSSQIKSGQVRDGRQHTEQRTRVHSHSTCCSCPKWPLLRMRQLCAGPCASVDAAARIKVNITVNIGCSVASAGGGHPAGRCCQGHSDRG
jgi:uncharacterized surface protein with fasciclin (FAS1) repeats